MVQLKPNGFKLLVQALEDVEDESMVNYSLAEVSEDVGHSLEFAAEIGNREVPLDEILERRLVEELRLDGEHKGAVHHHRLNEIL